MRKIYCLVLFLLGPSPSRLSAQCPPVRWTAAGASADDGLGIAAAIDGDTAVVGELRGQGLYDDDVGAAYVLVRTSEGWTKQARLGYRDNNVDDMFFAAAVDIEGDLIAVGAQREQGPYQESGAVYLFERVGTTWTRTHRLQPSVLMGVERRFGTAVALDGARFLVGATGYDGPVDESGAAFLYEEQGGAWINTARFMAPDGDEFDFFGASVAFHGSQVLVGASHHHGAGNNLGAVYVFTEVGGTWSLAQKLAPPDLQFDEFFGSSMATSGDTLFVGAPGKDDFGTSSGAVYVFEETGGLWVEMQKLHAATPGSSSFFGSALALEDGIAVVGSRSSSAAIDEGGAVDFYRFDAGTWTHSKEVRGEVSEGHLGTAVALGPEVAIIGAMDEDGDAPGAGAIYIGHPYWNSFVNYCDATPNSVGPGALMDLAGSLSLVDNDMTLLSTGAIPGAYGIYVYGPERGNSPLGDGVLCITPGATGLHYLFPPTRVATDGSMQMQVDFQLPPLGGGAGEITPGSQWNFQFLYRDPGAPFWAFGINLSDALEIGFCP